MSSVPAKGPFDEGSNVTFKVATTNSAYTILHWTKNGNTVSGSEGKTELTITATEDATYTAVFSPVEYEITYDGLKPGVTNSNPTTYTIESEITFKPPTEAVGWKFNGWNPPAIPKGSKGPKTVTASYLTIVYKPDVSSPLTYSGYSQTCASPGTGVVAEGNQATEVGPYTAKFTPMSGYCWSDGKTDSYVVDWEIVKATIENVSISQSETLTYNGQPQQAKVNKKESVKGTQVQATWKFSTSPGDYSETMPAFTDAGIHTVYYEVSAPNHESAYGSFAVTINHARTASVTVSPTHLPYTRQEQGPTVTLQNCAEISGSVKRATEIGTYQVKVRPLDNYAWAGGGTGEQTFGWTIDDSLYTVAFDGDGGTGKMESKILAHNEPYEIPACAFEKAGCEFQNWQVLIDDKTMTNFPAGIVVSNLTATAGKTVTFKAAWTGYYTIAYDGNGATNTVMATQLVERDVTTNLLDNAYVRPGYEFLGWDDAVNKKRYEDGAAVIDLAEVGATNTLWAAWSTNSYTVVFFGNGGTNAMESQTFSYDDPQPLRKNAFVRNGYGFAGWALDPAEKAAFPDDGQIVSNLTDEANGVVPLYAKWTIRGDGLSNEFSIAADCASNLADRVALDLKTSGNCQVENGEDNGGNGQFIKFGAGTNASIIEAQFTGSGFLTFAYKVTAGLQTEFQVTENPTGEVDAPVLSCKTNIIAWTEAGYRIPADTTVKWYFNNPRSTVGNACVDNIRFLPDVRDAGTVGVTFRLGDGSVFSNMTVVAGSAIGALPVPVDPSGRQFLGWAYQGEIIDSTWIVPASDDGVRLDAQWGSDEHPVPVDGKDNVTVSAAAVSADGKSFALTFRSDARFDYNLLTNANLLINSWGIMETQPGDGDILTFKPEILEGEPRLFYKVETIRRE